MDGMGIESRPQMSLVDSRFVVGPLVRYRQVKLRSLHLMEL